MCYLGDDEISVVQGDVVEVDEDVVVTEGGDVGFLIEFEAVEAAFALDGPLLGRCWGHWGCGCLFGCLWVSLGVGVQLEADWQYRVG